MGGKLLVQISIFGEEFTYLAARFKGLITLGARETLLMVRIAHCRYDFTFNILLAYGTLGAKHFLIIDHAIVDAIFGEESAGCQGLVTLDALKTTLMKIFISHP